MKIFILQKSCVGVITFSKFQERTTPIFKNFKTATYYKNKTSKLIYLYFKDQLLLKYKDIFNTNESVNPYNTRGGKLLFITQVNTVHYDIKSLRNNDPVMTFSEIPILIRTCLIQVSLNLKIS